MPFTTFGVGKHRRKKVFGFAEIRGRELPKTEAGLRILAEARSERGRFRLLSDALLHGIQGRLGAVGHM
jgi:hypothetical protein